ALAAPSAVRASDTRPDVLRVERGAVIPVNVVRVARMPPGKTWSGATSTDWATASNWTPANQPAAGDDVTIPANVASGNYPVVSTGTANAKTITMAAGPGTAPTLTISGGTLTVANTLTLTNGTVTVSGGTLSVTAASSITGTLNISSGYFLTNNTVTVNNG